MKSAIILALLPMLAWARPYTLIVAADGDSAWTKTLRSRMLKGREAHIYEFGRNSLAETLASEKWKTLLADVRKGDAVLLALGNNALTPELTRAINEAAAPRSYVGVVPPWSFDRKTFNDNRRKVRKCIEKADGYLSLLFNDALPEDKTAREFAEALLADAYANFSPIQRCGLDMDWYKKEVADRYTKIRIPSVNPVKPGELRLTPTFVSCGVDFGSPTELKDADIFVNGRRYPFPYFKSFKEHRGSVLRLQEDTEYTLEVRSGGRTVKKGVFRTWKSKVPVAKTVEIDPATADFPIVIGESGAPDAWIRYTVKNGAALVNETKHETIAVKKGAAYIIIEGIKFRGGKGRHVITLTDSRYVRIVNCEMSGWGREGKPNYFRLGQFRTPQGEVIDFDGAVNIGPRSVGTVIERCWMHDPTSRANSWFYSHPAGSEAVTVCRPDHSTVIRWCDFTGSDDKMWNDAVEGEGNFSDSGGFRRDADIYGNFMIGSNDDSIELDGGMRNVRCFDNRFENSSCGVSIQGCMVSPVYVFNNLFTGLGAEHGFAMQTIKTSSYDRRQNGSWSYIADNILWGRGWGLALVPDGVARFNVLNNVFCGRQKLTQTNAPVYSVGRVSGNRFGVEIAEEDIDPSYPKRPLAFVLDRARFSGITLKGGKLSADNLIFSAVHGGKGADESFSVVKNEVHDWFSVTPSAGKIVSGGRVDFKIHLDPKRMKSRRYYRGSFLVRTPQGLSRPVSLEVETDFEQPLKPKLPDGGFAAYSFLEKPVTVTGGSFPKTEFSFEVPKDGKYFLLLRCRRSSGGGKSKLNASIDGGKVFSLYFPQYDYSAWLHGGSPVATHPLKAGTHTLSVYNDEKTSLSVEAFAVTDSIGSFEPR